MPRSIVDCALRTEFVAIDLEPDVLPNEKKKAGENNTGQRMWRKGLLYIGLRGFTNTLNTESGLIWEFWEI